MLPLLHLPTWRWQRRCWQPAAVMARSYSNFLLSRHTHPTCPYMLHIYLLTPCCHVESAFMHKISFIKGWRQFGSFATVGVSPITCRYGWGKLTCLSQSSLCKAHNYQIANELQCIMPYDRAAGTIPLCFQQSMIL